MKSTPLNSDLKLQAAATTVDITPQFEVPLGAGEPGDSWQIHSRLEANLVALWVEDGAPLVLVSIDTLYPGPDIDRLIREQLDDVPPENIIVAASHTHAAPMLDPTKPALGSPSDEHLESVREALSKGISSLLDPTSRRPVMARAAKEKLNHSVNRRLLKRFYLSWPPRLNQLRWGPNFLGPRDETVTALELLDQTGHEIAVLWNYACHPVFFPRGRTVSSHYPGAVRERLRAEKGYAFPVLFFQGFSGNTRPTYLAEPRVPEGPRQMYRRARFGPSWVPVSEEAYEKWTQSLAEKVAKVLAGAQPIDIDSMRADRLLEARTNFVSPEGDPVSFQAVRLGRQFGLVAVSAELVAEYNGLVRRGLGTRFAMPISCVGNTVGYLPTNKMLAEGGYEAGGFLERFGLESLSPLVQGNAEAAIRQVVSGVGGRSGPWDTIRACVS